MVRAIIAGSGALPEHLFLTDPHAIGVALEGVQSEIPGTTTQIPARFEKLGALFDGLRSADVTQVIFAGAMQRPALDPKLFDSKTAELALRLLSAMGQGDDALMRQVISIFESEGFLVLGAHEVAPDLVVGAGHLAGPEVDEGLHNDAARGKAILAALGPYDVGQAVVVGQGLCLGIETLAGTGALLDFVARTRRGGVGGVLVKLPKPGQELRADMPTIGPDTVRSVAAAGLTGIMIAAGQVIVLDRAETMAEAGASGISLWAEGPI
jgi:DUF1009 family protein